MYFSMSYHWAIASLVTAASALHGTQVNVPANLNTRVLLRDAVGYSIEPTWVTAYVSNTFGSTLLKVVGDLTGKPPPIRVGGNTADQTWYIPDLKGVTQGSDSNYSVSPAWYRSWGNYFPNGTDLIYSLNFRDTARSWANAQAQAKVVWELMGDKVTMFELGNEIDHFQSKGWRDRTWGIKTYIQQFRTLTGSIVQSAWYRSANNPPKFQAGVFADPPWVPDQQVDKDDFDILNLTRGGLTDPKHEVIETYCVHLYPQSTCDSPRWHRMRLDLLSNHTVLWLNVSQYVPQVAAADAFNTPLVLGETNSVSCSGKSGISDTFGAALWTVDYVLMAASIGIEKTYFHLGAHSEYSTFTPLPYSLKGENLEAGIRANWYGHYFVARVVARENPNDSFGIAALPSANSSDLSGYAVLDRNNNNALKKVVLLDMGVWNGTQGLSNPSTLKATDGTSFSKGTRPSFNMSVTTSWKVGQNISVTRLSGPGTNAKSGVSVSGVTFNTRTGSKVGTEKMEYVTVKDRGVVEFSMQQAEGILLEA